LADAGRDGGARIPKLRKGNYFPGFLEPRRLAEKAIAAACSALKSMRAPSTIAAMPPAASCSGDPGRADRCAIAMTG